VLLIEKGTGKVTEATVNLTEGKIETLTEVPSGNQPALTPEDCFEAERIGKLDGDVRKRCAMLGFEDMDLVTADPWYVSVDMPMTRLHITLRRHFA
jgi:Cu2+-containing amine oxidase